MSFLLGGSCILVLFLLYYLDNSGNMGVVHATSCYPLSDTRCICGNRVTHIFRMFFFSFFIAYNTMCVPAVWHTYYLYICRGFRISNKKYDKCVYFLLQSVLHWGAKHGNAEIIKVFAGKYKVNVNGKTVTFNLNYF